MWPKRKIRLVAPPEASGLKGVEQLLKTLEIDIEVVAPNQLDEWRSPIWEFGSTPPTEILLWASTHLDKESLARLASLGIEIQDVGSFLHNLWQDDIVIAQPLNTPLLAQKPLAYQILNQAGFAPSLLWPQADGQWLGTRGEGLVWIVPAEWLNELGLKSVGRPPGVIFPDVYWVIREEIIDFYSQKDGQRYMGSIERWPERDQEEVACQAIAQVLRLGVPWKDISDSIGSVKYRWVRWNSDELGSVAGESDAQLSLEQFEHLENRRAS